MSIFNEIEQSQDAIVTQAVNAFVQHNNNSLVNLITNAEYSFNLFWSNPSATPQQICDKLGTSAVMAFETANAVFTLIHALQPSYVPPNPPLPYVINPDGTVIINPVTTTTTTDTTTTLP